MIKNRFKISDIWILLGFLVIYIAVFDTKIDVGGDNAGYYILGKSISSGLGYTDIHLPNANPANHFPPGYPIILSVFMNFSDDFVFLKIINGLFFFFSLLMLQRIFERMAVSKSLSVLAIIFTIINAHILRSSMILMSEIPFLFFSLSSLTCLIKWNDQGNLFWRSKWFWVMIVLCAISYHIRTAGIALIIGICLFMIFEKKWSGAFVFLLSFLGLSLPWFYRGIKLGGNSYLTQIVQVNPYRPEEGLLNFSGWLDRISNNLFRYVNQEIPNGLFPNFDIVYSSEEPKGYFIYGLILIFFIFIGTIKMPRLRMMWLGYLTSSVSILLLWPSVWFGVRFMLPLMPFLFLAMVVGLSNSMNFIQRKYLGQIRMNSSYLIMLVCFLPLTQLAIMRSESKSNLPLEYSNYFNISRYVKSSIPENSIVCTVKPSLFYLYSSTKSSRIPSIIETEKFIHRLEDLGITHVIIDQLGYSSLGRYLMPAIEEFPQRFNLIMQLPNPDTYLLEFVRKDSEP